MIEGMKILLERMKTHPEEFIDKKFGGLPSKWSNLVDRYRHVLTDEEIEAYQQAYKELQRQHFTASVLESLLEEPVELDPNTYTIKTAGRNAWSTSTLSIAEQVLKDKEKLFEDAYKDELRKLIHQEKTNLTKAVKNKTKIGLQDERL